MTRLLLAAVAGIAVLAVRGVRRGEVPCRARQAQGCCLGRWRGRILPADGLPAAPVQASAAASKAEDLHYLSQQSAAQLTDRNYEKLVLGRGREYDLFVLYTAREAQYGCGICGYEPRLCGLGAGSGARAAPLGG